MAGIIVSEASNTTNALFGELQSPLRMLLEREYEAWMNSEEAKILEEIFVDIPITTASTALGGLTGSNSFEPVGENGAYPQGGIEQGYFKTFRPITWKGSFSISMEMMEDKLESVLKGQPIQFLDDFRRAKNNFFWGLLGNAIQNKDTVKVGVETFDLTAKDEVKLFSQSHKIKKTGKTQSNAFSNAFFEANLGLVATAMQNLKTDSGDVGNLAPDTIIIPNDAKAKADVFGVLGAYHDTSTAAGNKYNYQFGNWNVIVTPYLVPYMGTSGYPWILADLEYNKRNLGAVNINRKPLTVRSEIEANDANTWKGNSRFTGGFYDYRAFAVGGVAFGSTLS